MTGMVADARISMDPCAKRVAGPLAGSVKPHPGVIKVTYTPIVATHMPDPWMFVFVHAGNVQAKSEARRRNAQLSPSLLPSPRTSRPNSPHATWCLNPTGTDVRRRHW